MEGPREPERRNLVVAAAIMLAAAAEARAFGGSAGAARDVFLPGLLAAQVAIAWWRTTPGIAVAIIITGAILTLSLSQRSGYFGVAAVLAGAALAGAATFWSMRSANGGGRRRCRRLPPPEVRYAPASARSFSASSRFWSAVIFLNSFSSARRLMTWFQ